MEISRFILENPFLSFFLILFSLDIVKNLVCRVFRYFNLYINGYPPPYCDADGDFRELSDAEQKEFFKHWQEYLKKLNGDKKNSSETPNDSDSPGLLKV